MTRKALRKKLRTLVASAAVTAAHSTTISAAVLTDPRLRVVHEVFTTSVRSSSDVQRPGAFPGVGAAQDPPVRRFDIPAGALAGVLTGFEQATGFKVTLSIEAIGAIQSPGVAGLFSVQRALEILLEGTSVTFRNHHRHRRRRLRQGDRWTHGRRRRFVVAEIYGAAPRHPADD